MKCNIVDMMTNKNHASIIKVIGVGSFGVQALNYMYEKGIKGVNFFVCNTDEYDLKMSKVPVKIPIGTSSLGGFGAGGLPDRGRSAAIEDEAKIRGIFEQHAKMTFIAAGMGGGTGTGATPVIAKIAKEMGLLTIAVLALPPLDEGEARMEVAIKGIREVAQYADSVLIINNEKVFELYSDEVSFEEARESVYKVLNNAVKGISELITIHGHINLDFADVNTIANQSGVAVMGIATTSGEDRALNAIKQALTSPLLMSSDVRRAKQILLNIAFSSKKDEAIKLSELDDIANYVDDVIGEDANIITGVNYDDSLVNQVSVTIIATGFGLEGVLERRYLISSTSPSKRHRAYKSVKGKVPIFEGNKVWVTPELSEDFIIKILREPAHTRANKVIESDRSYGAPKTYKLKEQ